MNELQKYFESNKGRLIDKWLHYFEIYDRYFNRFKNTNVNVLEIGVYKAVHCKCGNIILEKKLIFMA